MKELQHDKWNCHDLQATATATATISAAGERSFSAARRLKNAYAQQSRKKVSVIWKVLNSHNDVAVVENEFADNLKRNFGTLNESNFMTVGQ